MTANVPLSVTSTNSRSRFESQKIQEDQTKHVTCGVASYMPKELQYFTNSYLLKPKVYVSSECYIRVEGIQCQITLDIFYTDSPSRDSGLIVLVHMAQSNSNNLSENQVQWWPILSEAGLLQPSCYNVV